MAEAGSRETLSTDVLIVGAGPSGLAAAIRIKQRHPDIAVVYAMHRNPKVRETARAILGGLPQVRLIAPPSYFEFVGRMRRAELILTDSGGIQEETTALGVPCITMRTTTERPVTCDLGTNVLVAPRSEPLRMALGRMLDEPRKPGAVPPLWDGRASERIASTIIELFHTI